MVTIAMADMTTIGFIGTLSPWHLMILAVVALLIFGHRLPSVARGMGRSIVEFKKGLKGVQDDLDEAEKQSDRESRYDDRRDDRRGREVDDGRRSYNQPLPGDERGGRDVRVSREPVDSYRDQAR
jgi:sec-independent protein translocase protein TatA